MMEVGTEISQKIRSAIKAKLIELGAYVDDELPDYIMMMVANKKSEEQMVADLKLFLGSNTLSFAEWLHGLLRKLQTISVDAGSSTKTTKEKDKSESKKKEKVKKTKSVKSGKSKTSDGKGKTHSRSDASKKTVKLVEANDEINPPKSINIKGTESQTKANEESHSTPTEVEEDVRQLLVTAAPTDTDELAAELESTEATIQEAKTAKEVKSAEREKKKSPKITAPIRQKRSVSPRDSKVSSNVAKKHKGLSSVIANVSKDNEDEEEYDPLCPAVGSVASVVKVTGRKSKVPAAMQANRALLVKAMGEAERSIAIKRKAFTSSSSKSDEAATEYSPKRRKSSGKEASPPPYIPSKKEISPSAKTRSSHSQHQGERDRRDSRTDARQLLSARDQRDLISRSRRMELFKSVGIQRTEKPIRVRLPESEISGLDEDQRETRISVSTREVTTNKKNADGIRDLRIMARLGPVKGRVSYASGRNLEESASQEKGYRATLSKDDMLQVVINPVASPALKGSIASRLGKGVTKNEYSDDQSTCSGENLRSKSAGVGAGRNRGANKLALSRQAKLLVNKQCEEAVISVKNTSQRFRQHRSASPDSRVVEADDVDETESPEGLARSASLSPSRSDDRELEQESKSERPSSEDKDVESGSENNEKDTEDLANMINQELEPELLNDSVSKDLNQDLEKENGDAEDLETMIGVKLEDEKPKPGTRFIVTLDGVDESRFDAETEKNKNSGMQFMQPSIPGAPKLLPVGHYGPQSNLPQPVAVLSPQAGLIQVLPSTQPLLPPHPVTLPMREQIKPQPPKIQPFSINVKDSDDELDDKESRAQSSVPGYTTQMSTESLSALQKAKMSERCKFWPACAAGAQCEFHHPTSYCKTFPNCKFGDKCLFIHPNCRFDSKCARPDCPFTHTSRRSGVPQAPVPVSPPAPSPASTMPCRFFPNCHNAHCPFLHPKPCRFGVACLNPSCPFFHPPTVPTKDQLKWKAQTQKEAASTVDKLPVTVPDPTAKFRQPVAKVSPMSSGSSTTR